MSEENEQTAVIDALRNGGSLKYFYLSGGVAVHDNEDKPSQARCSISLFLELREAALIVLSQRKDHGYPYYANNARHDVYRLNPAPASVPK